MKDNSKYIAIGLVIVTLIVVILTSIMKDNNEEKIETEPLIVENYSDFYTVNSCLYRTITYVSTHDKESLFLLVSDEYKNKNKITKENVLDLFPNIEANSTFVSQKMYYEDLSNGMTKYYVKGYVKKNELFDDRELVKLDTKTEYFIVYLDSLNGIFAIEPYNGSILKKVIQMNEKHKTRNIIILVGILVAFSLIYIIIDRMNEEKDEREFIKYIKDYEINEYIPTYVSDSDMAKIYLNDYIYIMHSDIEKAYSLLDSEYRNKKFGSIDSFKNYVNSLTYTSYKMDSFYTYNENDYRFFGVYDKNGNLFIFKTKGVMQYTVYLDNDTVEI